MTDDARSDALADVFVNRVIIEGRGLYANLGGRSG